MVKTHEIETYFSLSQSTARRYLINLEKSGLIKRSYGEIIFNNLKSIEDPNVVKSINSNLNSKKKIAKRAANLIQNNKTIFIDSGSMCYYLLDYIYDKEVEIFTNSILNAYKAIGLGFKRVNIIGGFIKHKTLSVVEISQDVLEKINFPIAFIGVNAIGSNGELKTPEKREAEVKQSVISKSKKVIILADKTKFETESVHNFRPKNKEIFIVTDKNDIDHLSLINTKIINA